MITVLAIDTSTNYVTCGIAQVALTGSVEILAEREVDNARGHMELLTPNILDCLQEARLRPSDVNAVVVGCGPGPFTGLRVGMATGAAFADALGVPVYSVPSLAATAWQHVATRPMVGSAPRRIVVLADARRREWYHASFELQPSRAGVECRCVSPSAVSAPQDVIAAHGLAHDSSAEVLCSASIADAVTEGVSSSDTVVPDAHPTTTGLIRAAIAQEHSAVGLLRPTDPPRALYLRRPDAVVPHLKGVSQAVNTAAVEAHELAEHQRYDREGDGGGAEEWPAIDPAQVRIEPLEPDHAPLVAALEKRLFADEAPWSAETVRMAIGTPFTSFLGLFRGDELVGYADLAVLGSPQDAEAEVQNIAIAPEHQGKGYSRLLMDQMMAIADRLHAPVFLEVRTDNRPAIGLYECYGFQIQGTRRGYYQPSGADAYTMMRPPHAPAETEQPAEGNPRFIMGVESSCDETGVGIIEINGDGDGATLRIASDQVASSMEQHARFGGVVPEIASRAHLEAMQPVMRAALQVAGIEKPSAVAATIGPGLAGALLVGAAAAKAYAAAWEVPFYAVNHLGGHVAVDTLVDGVDTSTLDNAIALLVSGGHTQILHVQGVGKPMEELGSTLDDAAGEAYDKVARLLGLGYPGGPIIDRLASKGNPDAIKFPRGMMRPQDARYDFSFSGLKTAVARYVEQAERAGETILVEDLCASFQEAAVDVLTVKALRACEDKGAQVLLLGGGVSANRRLRDLAAQRCAEAGVELHVPPLELCTDNGVMIAALASHLILAGESASDLHVATDPSLDVETPLL
ncbi:tRNA (adenosine(37)-N6)-threonylcarbamoyltransferase complex transferase subunit TsaD [Corynebacterium sp. 320]|uniref:tRNA (adenosine(37)-N6)-threonylcarbamoyltransferase complex transferase subunit TsaD n=1 Tax=Corynebacterium TaxID=1716 RepID=UPI00125CB9A2|nr:MULTISPECIES: tRNA (adenosine(37)-N6)-threonylcarbamoyltransferase complex transferase subunit TsaD [Corynebacterium]KAB1504242.1 tRNA (adenosine(37)-N6)-threonylcarbamoyltransferase complex transferase subunit TsaD [Corynebacterium sp. 320]KAB1552658.1 tRNA (adenosine(37)-N6)-threonylcarbamoyltransferase complex transferase subunit TsaD [Corynebacterium sp. 321]KAB1554124.1 tRNA (adenosine(37)-N6)-threonylcarbamoyltransferase complex transferase subunit TsaD [Corynebacterium sp. 319]KAB3528